MRKGGEVYVRIRIRALARLPETNQGKVGAGRPHCAQPGRKGLLNQ